MTVLLNGADSARPGQLLPPGISILCGYIGAKDLPGQPDAVRVWTLEEWNLYLDPYSPLFGGPQLRVLPIFVHDYPGDPVQLANNACDALVDLGWSDKLGRLVYLDIETLIQPVYVAGVAAQMASRGFNMGKYGSAGTINANPRVPGGTWMATDTKARPVTLPPGCVGDQWLFGEPWDYSVFSPFVYANCGEGQRIARP